MYKKIFYIIVLCLVLAACKQNYEMTVQSHSSSDENKFLDGDEEEDRTDEQNQDIQDIFESIEKIDFSIREYSVDKEKYDEELDALYKSAFFEAITNQIPIYLAYDDGSPRYYRNLLRGVADLDNKEFFDGVIKRAARYYYFDYDGDGLPELTIDFDGPSVLKYIPDKNQVWLIESIGSKATVIGSGQIYVYDSEAANRVTYSYYSTGKDGVKDYIYFEKNSSDGVDHCFISIDERHDTEAIEVNRNVWEELRTPLISAKENAIEPLKYEDIFDEGFDW